jgi:hypothetical protein
MRLLAAGGCLGGSLGAIASAPEDGSAVQQVKIAKMSLQSLLSAHGDHELCSRRRKEADFHSRSFSASLRRRLQARSSSLVPRPSSSCSIFWRRDGFEDEDEGRAREHLAEERFMERRDFKALQKATLPATRDFNITN